MSEREFGDTTIAAQEVMHTDTPHCREIRPRWLGRRTLVRIGSSFWPRSTVLTRILKSALVAIVVLGLAIWPSTVAWASVSCDGMAICHPCDAVPRGCPHALACVKLIPQKDTAEITGPYWDKVDWETGSPRLAGMEVPPEHPPPIV